MPRQAARCLCVLNMPAERKARHTAKCLLGSRLRQPQHPPSQDIPTVTFDSEFALSPPREKKKGEACSRAATLLKNRGSCSPLQLPGSKFGSSPSSKGTRTVGPTVYAKLCRVLSPWCQLEGHVPADLGFRASQRSRLQRHRHATVSHSVTATPLRLLTVQQRCMKSCAHVAECPKICSEQGHTGPVKAAWPGMHVDLHP